MNDTNLKTNPLGLLIALLAGVAWMVACDTYGGTVCHSGAYPQRFSLPYVASTPYAAPVVYSIGQNIQRDAVDTQAFRASAEYQDYLRLQGYHQAVLDVAAQPAQQSQPEPQPAQQESWTKPADPVVPPQGSDPWPEGKPAEPVASSPHLSADQFKELYPLLIANNCVKCHGDPRSKGGQHIVINETLPGEPSVELNDKLARMATEIVNGRMPKGKPLDPQGQYDQLVEIFAEHDVPVIYQRPTDADSAAHYPGPPPTPPVGVPPSVPPQQPTEPK